MTQEQEQLISYIELLKDNINTLSSYERLTDDEIIELLHYHNEFDISKKQLKELGELS